jgi:hypothetical protein
MIVKNLRKMKLWQKLLDRYIAFARRMVGRNVLSLKGQINQGILYAKDLIQEQNDLQLSAIIHTIDRCSVLQFEDCLIDNRLEALGAGTQSQLESAWLSIYSEYLSMIDGGRNETHIKHLGSIYSLAAKIRIVKMLTENVIITGYNDYFLSLEAWGYRIDKMDDVKDVIAAIKSDEMQLSIMVKNLPEVNKDEPITRQYFDKLIVEFEAMQNIPLNKETLMMNKFCVYYQKFSAKINQTKSINQRNAK